MTTEIALVPKVVKPDSVYGRNDPRLIAAVKDWATKNIQRRVNEKLDELDEEELFHAGDSIKLTYTLDIGEGILDILAHACGVKLP